MSCFVCGSLDGLSPVFTDRGEEPICLGCHAPVSPEDFWSPAESMHVVELADRWLDLATDFFEVASRLRATASNREQLVAANQAWAVGHAAYTAQAWLLRACDPEDMPF